MFSNYPVPSCIANRTEDYPAPPKRGASPYTLFFQDYFSKNRSNYLDPENGRLKITDLARDCGKAWGDLPYGEVQTYTEASKKDRAAAQAAYEKWYTSLTPEQLRAAQADRKRPILTPGGKEAFKRRLDDAPGNPGRPIGPFFLFLRDMTPKIAQEAQAKTLVQDGVSDGKPRMELRRYIGKRAGELWNELTDAQKEEYKKKNREMREKYDAWKKEYEEKK